MPTVELLSKAIAGESLTESDRFQLTPPMLAQLAVGGHIQLWATDRRRMTKAMLGYLAMCGCIELTRTERNSLSPQTLAILTVSQNMKLDDSEIGRLPLQLRKVIKQRHTFNRIKVHANSKATHRYRSKAV